MIYNNENIELLNNDHNELPKGLIKKGVKLPKCKREWEQANEYFKTNIHHNNEINDINQEINILQDKLYNFFAEAYGECDETEKNPYETNYNAYSKNKLKRSLKLLKSTIPQKDDEIKVCSKSWCTLSIF